MCDYSGKLIAWLDRELPAEQAARVEQHLKGCPECRSDVAGYKLVSSEFDAWCDQAMASRGDREIPRWVPAALAAGAVAALVALFLVLPRTRVEPPAIHPSRAAAEDSPAIVEKRKPTPASPTIQRVHRRQGVAPVEIREPIGQPAQSQGAYFLPDEPVIRISIPADEMFPPGAVPEGMHFAADLAIAADGSAEGLRLRPRLAAFERRTTLP